MRTDSKQGDTIAGTNGLVIVTIGPFPWFVVGIEFRDDSRGATTGKIREGLVQLVMVVGAPGL